MAETNPAVTVTKKNLPSARPSRPHRRARRILLWLGSTLCILFIALLVTGDILLHRARPMLKEKVIATLSTRFDSRVELDGFHVSMVKGFQVSGSGLKLYPRKLDMTDPLIQVDQFSFHALGWRQLLRTPMYINRVQVNGLSIHMPPKQQRHDMPHFIGNSGPGDDKSNSGIKILVGEILVDHADLVIENGKPGKVPLDFVIHQLVLHSVGQGRAMKFHATLVNPKPVGDIDSTGDFGPFDADSPGDTPVDGHYSFSHADLFPIKGIGGTLASTGDYQGQLNHIDVTGETTTPNFSLDTTNRPVPLNTKFHAIVDGTNGDTYLQPVDAWLAKTHILAQGKVVRSAGVPGKHILLDVTVGPGRIQDLLELAVKTQPALMNGQIQMKMNLDLPPGPASVTQKLHLTGTFAIDNVHFNNDKFQHDVDQLSLRGQGKAGAAKQEDTAMKAGNSGGGTAADIASEMRGQFIFGGAKLTVSNLNYQVPGAQIALSGFYSLDGEQFDFRGNARLDAHVSQTVTGWKSWLLKPVDPFFAKNGAGTQVPIKITGTKASPQIGLNY
ncbi:MAG TPA: hypothetical protein VIY53_05190 [Acidobacteriaceae bacterium]